MDQHEGGAFIAVSLANDIDMVGLLSCGDAIALAYSVNADTAKDSGFVKDVNTVLTIADVNSSP